MMLAQTKRGEKIERHSRDQIVVLRRTDVRAVVRIARLQSQAEILPIIWRRFHVTSLVSEWRSRNPSAPLLVFRGIQARRATGRTDRCVSAFVYGKEMREVYRRRARPLRPEPDTLSRREH